jgi:PII-like signaling protein
VSRDAAGSDRPELRGAAQRLTVLVGEGDVLGHRPLYTEIVHRARAAGLAGATVVRGIEGYGASQQIHTNRLLSLSEDLPVSVVIVDAKDRIEAFLPQIEELVTEGLIMVDDVWVVRHVGRGPAV